MVDLEAGRSLALQRGLPRAVSATHSTQFENYREKASPYLRHYREWDIWDDYWYDRRYQRSPADWPYAAWANRRNYNLDPPQAHWNNFPSLGWTAHSSKYAFIDQGQIDPAYWRRYRDPHYDRPLYYPYRPWVYESMDKSRARQQHDNGLIATNTLEKYWLAERPWAARWADYTPPYRPPTYYTSPDRYNP